MVLSPPGRADHAPSTRHRSVCIWENGFIRAFGPRLGEAGLNLIPSFPYAGPLEELRLKKQ